jgi:hypothetical protein
MVVIDGDRRLKDDELAAAKRRRRYARASLACEGLHPTPAQEALFDRFERERLSHDQRRRVLAERARARAAGRTPA